jgi:hypothetical protein
LLRASIFSVIFILVLICEVSASGAILTRDMPEDVVIHVTHPNDTAMTLKKGSRVIFDMIAAREYLFQHPITGRHSA